MAEEMVDFVKNQILVQTGTTMLAQANIQGHGVLRLLGM
jgi:flagellin